jgi:HSP20 family protein
MAIQRPSRFPELLPLREVMERLMGEAFISPRTDFESGASGMAVDMKDTGDTLTVEAAVPGAKPEDLTIEVVNGQLSIKAETKEKHEEKQDGYLLREIRRSSRRVVTLPSEVDTSKADAKLNDGLLTITLPKAKSAQSSRIEVKS